MLLLLLLPRDGMSMADARRLGRATSRENEGSYLLLPKFCCEDRGLGMPLGRWAVMWKGKGNREGREGTAFRDLGRFQEGVQCPSCEAMRLWQVFFSPTTGRVLESGWQRAGRGGRFGLSAAESRPRPRSTQRPFGPWQGTIGPNLRQLLMQPREGWRTVQDEPGQ